ncbi:carboxypeptidase-like regulatory domain-containing protein [Mucilaginibacter endophyticus]|uniref:carboxypeptidase-like regulatory domain-containing protein n=1 Tax=Mucilaginibacter endophyticus TaxID=2675003 RepID=UPI000E0CF0E8|nr:carboxypeptidase-like regulatory domain-containing protein [Mucilaginibacter endophyticus]
MLKKLFLCYLLVSPFWCLAQTRITGRVINATDKKTIANASVFLSNATVGTKTTPEGTFTLVDAKNGKYELVVSIVGFETYKQNITVTGSDMVLPDIIMSPKTYALKEVIVKQHTDPNRAQYLTTFKEQFLGKSELADQCKILNPEMLDFAYNDDTKTLAASSVDFLTVENRGLGYRVKYLITNFIYDDKDISNRKLHYEGSVLFEELKGTPSQQKDWERARLQVYKGSAMHFLRALQAKHLDEEGFRVLQYANPERRDLPKSLLSKRGRPILMTYPLNEDEMMVKTDQIGVHALGCDFDSFHITYNEDHRFTKRGQMNSINSTANHDVTVLNFNLSYALFDDNGALLDPNSVTYSGAWGNNRVAELLPVDYEPLNTRAVNEKPGLTDVINKLRNYNASYTAEKVYLHFDKPYYAAGDTVYFKAYITAGDRHELSDISGVLHAELINTANRIDQSVKLQITDGVAWGDFALPDTLPKGNYHIRAYTKWMQNQGSNNYFDREIKIGSINNKIAESAAKAPLPVVANKIDVQFFAEGGNMITGIQSKIAFKAIGANGTGVNISGIITDDENNQVATFASSHLGMGSFYLKAQPGKSYKAELNYADGTKNTVNLPMPMENGISLSVDNSEIPRAIVKINAADAFYQQNKGREFTLLIYSGGTASTIACRLDSQTITRDILKRRLKTGIATITLFSAANEPLCERLIFVQNYDQLSLAINSPKADYKKRERVDISLNVKNRAGDPSVGHFSVSVIDENKVQVVGNSERTILTDLLLTSDLKGNVEQPNYYFTNVNDETTKNLDLVMLTNGYRGFKWKPLLSSSYPAIAYQPEKGLEISGNVKRSGGSAMHEGTVSLISSQPTTVLSQPVDDRGDFAFSNLFFTDTGRFILQAVTAKGDNSTRLTYNKNNQKLPVSSFGLNVVPNDINLSMTNYLENNKLRQDDYLKYSKIKMLKEVKIKAVKKNEYRSSALGGPGSADQVIQLGQLPVSGSLTQMVESRVHGGRAYAMLRSDFDGLVILDGVAIDSRISANPIPGGGSLDFIGASDVETVEFFYNANAAIYGARGGHGVIVITTKAKGGLTEKEITSTGILPISVPGFYKARVFYSPKYENLEQAGNRPDLRSTIYWQPELITDKNGQALFNYFNADGAGSYRIVIEGIDEDGNLGRLVYRYNVQ